MAQLKHGGYPNEICLQGHLLLDELDDIGHCLFASTDVAPTFLKGLSERGGLKIGCPHFFHSPSPISPIIEMGHLETPFDTQTTTFD